MAAREGGGTWTPTHPADDVRQGAGRIVPDRDIERAIKRGTGELEAFVTSRLYEGYAPSGVAVIVECLTDNRNRTGADIRSLFLERRLHGGAWRGLVGFRAKRCRHVPKTASPRTTSRCLP